MDGLFDPPVDPGAGAGGLTPGADGLTAAPTPTAPLAVRMRPQTLDEIVGQQHLLGDGSPLRRLVGEQAHGPAGPSSVILWGPPGTGTAWSWSAAASVG